MTVVRVRVDHPLVRMEYVLCDVYCRFFAPLGKEPLAVALNEWKTIRKRTKVSIAYGKCIAAIPFALTDCSNDSRAVKFLDGLLEYVSRSGDIFCPTT